MTYSCHSGANLNYLPIAKIRRKNELETIFNKKTENYAWDVKDRFTPVCFE